VIDAAEKLTKAVTSLLLILRETRLKLSLEHIVPYVETPAQTEAQSRWG
jgi:hypothetical protein